ncbi:MAG: acetolactate synthase large subunit, partial [Burkholderiales bacterium]|nr:acetolactate synthase large subunit [Burkholderiales bacterium]
GKSAAILLGGAALRGKALEWAGRIAAKTGCRLFCEYNNARMERGAGRATVRQLPFAVDAALAMLQDVRELVLVGAKTPVSFFAYPGKPSVLVLEGCSVTKVAGAEADLEQALEAMADALGVRGSAPLVNAAAHDAALPAGAITPDGLGALFNALLPENAIVVDEAVTSGRTFTGAMMGARPHDWLNIMGGSIGWGPAAAAGAAVAAPGRKVVAFEGDGSAQYTLQALWTMARENLDVTMVIFANRAYKILVGELANVGGGEPGANARAMLTLDRPDLDWVALAKGYGVEAGRAATLEELAAQFRRGLAVAGPYLIEVVM